MILNWSDYITPYGSMPPPLVSSHVNDTLTYALATSEAPSVTVTCHVDMEITPSNTVAVNVGFDMLELLIVGVLPDVVDMWLHE